MLYMTTKVKKEIRAYSQNMEKEQKASKIAAEVMKAKHVSVKQLCS